MSDFEFYPLAILFAASLVSLVGFPWTQSTWGAMGIIVCIAWVLGRTR